MCRRPRSARASSCRSARASSPASSSAIETSSRSAPTSAVKPIREVLDDEAFVPGDVVALARWTAEYYAAGAGDAIRLLSCRRRRAAAAPTRTRRGASRRSPPPAWARSRPKGTGVVFDPKLEANGAGAFARGWCENDPRPFSLTTKQLEALELLAGTPTGIPTPELAARGIAADTTRAAGQAGIRQPAAGSRRPRSVRHRQTYEAATTDPDAAPRPRSRQARSRG